MARMRTICLGTAVAVLALCRAAAAQADGLTGQLRQAQEHIKARHYPQAQALLREVEAANPKTAEETCLLERTRAALAGPTGEQALLTHALEAALAACKALPPAEAQAMVEELARTYYRQKDYPKAIVWLTRYFRDGGNDTQMRRWLLYAYYLNRDFSRAAQEAAHDIQIQERAGKTPAEYVLRLLVSCAQQLNDSAAYDSAVRKYASHYPKPP